MLAYFPVAQLSMFIFVLLHNSEYTILFQKLEMIHVKSLTTPFGSGRLIKGIGRGVSKSCSGRRSASGQPTYQVVRPGVVSATNHVPEVGSTKSNFEN